MEEGVMANVVKKDSISSELAQKMISAAVAKAKELGVSENVTILDDGGNLKAFSRMDGAPVPTIEMAQNKAYTALLGVSTQDFFNFIQGDPSLLAGIPTLARMAAWGGGFPAFARRPPSYFRLPQSQQNIEDVVAPFRLPCPQGIGASLTKYVAN